MVLWVLYLISLMVFVLQTPSNMPTSKLFQLSIYPADRKPRIRQYFFVCHCGLPVVLLNFGATLSYLLSEIASLNWEILLVKAVEFHSWGTTSKETDRLPYYTASLLLYRLPAPPASTVVVASMRSTHSSRRWLPCRPCPQSKI